MEAILYLIVALVLATGFRTLMHRLQYGDHRARRAYIWLWLIFGIVMLAVFAVLFHEIIFSPPSVLHGFALLMVLALPVALIVLGVFELRDMRRNRTEESRAHGE